MHASFKHLLIFPVAGTLECCGDNWINFKIKNNFKTESLKLLKTSGVDNKCQKADCTAKCLEYKP